MLHDNVFVFDNAVHMYDLSDEKHIASGWGGGPGLSTEPRATTPFARTGKDLWHTVVT
jgi:hypothetical protein